MRTEITIPFAFDTAPIEETLQKHGEEEAVRKRREMVEENVVKKVPKKWSNYHGRTDEPDWSEFLRCEFNEWLSEHATEIIDEAALLLAQRASGRKAWKDVLTEVKREMGDNE